jgi:REP element-mobilizing transposase RayT
MTIQIKKNLIQDMKKDIELKKYVKDIKSLNKDELDDLNPFEIISGEIMPNHVEQFIKERSSQDLQKFWQDEIKLNGGK